jgi:ribosome-associated toxin RatA of RatAB toxin-antitoxin module
MLVRRSALVDRPACQLFDLIEAAERYPEFLPWCTGATIVSRDDAVVSADITVRFKGMDFSFRTRNPKHRPEYMAIHLEHGPFHRFEGEWRLTPLDASACKVAFALDYAFSSPMLTQTTGPLFGRIAGALVDAFVQRALSQPTAVPSTVWRSPAEGSDHTR